MYNSKRAGESVKITTQLGVGIQDNVSLKNVRVQESVNGNTFIVFEWERKNSDGTVSSVNCTEWPQNRFPDMTDDQYNLALDRQFRKLEQIVKALGYSSDEDLAFSGDWKDLCAWVQTKWETSATKDGLFRIKFVYDNRNYIGFPRTISKFVEPMSVVAEGKSEIQIKPSDKLVPVTGDKEEAPSLAAVTDKVTEDLPF